MRGKGCRFCRNTGYKGRTAIHEVLLVNDAIRDAILARKTSAEIRHIGRTAAGLISLREHGIYKSLKGVTNLEEVMRVVFHSESDQYSPRSLAEIFDICEMIEFYGTVTEIKAPFMDELPEALIYKSFLEKIEVIWTVTGLARFPQFSY